MTEREQNLKRIKSKWNQLTGKEIAESIAQHCRTYLATEASERKEKTTTEELLAMFNGNKNTLFTQS